MDASPCIANITDDDRRVVWASRAFGRQFRTAVVDAISPSSCWLSQAAVASSKRTSS
ncbi:hypothetical protein ENSA5_00900 [Enhygromyxa salina]|uniref:Uncharacterized protein n=1 Tax=Enhygromyxa salina TaxID=215803 RepID=A0A2S9YKY4_9BACT|nr:hypothetical protein ENSA5_00900 [Enhygromyxa salina]